MHNSKIENLDLDEMEHLYTSTIMEKEAFYPSRNESALPKIVPSSLTSAIFFSTSSAKTNKSNSNNSTSSREEFQFYVIGIYSFFALVFGFGLIIILLKKLQKACCSLQKADCPDYETVPHRESFNSQDNLGFDHNVNVSFLDVEGRNHGHDSDFDYYSDTSNGEKDSPGDKPPAYEDPPSYSIVLPQ